MLSQLKLLNFRSYSSASFNIAPGANAIIGLNGSGKTNLMESLYVLARQKSFRTVVRSLVHYDETFFRIDGIYNDRTLSFRYQTDKAPHKSWVIDGQKQALKKQWLPKVVLFEPDFLRFITGSPTRRREYLDELTILLYPESAVILRRYARTLLQRNNFLKQNEYLSVRVKDQLFVWNMLLADYATMIDCWRLEVVEVINERISEIYSTVADKQAHVSFSYPLVFSPNRQNFLDALDRTAARDLAIGHTSIGPHRNDLSITLNAEAAEETASRGEQRSIAIGLKLIELSMYPQDAEMPILLLDDVLSELDAIRQEKLLSLITSHQTLITDTDAKHVRHLEHVNFIRL